VRVHYRRDRTITQAPPPSSYCECPTPRRGMRMNDDSHCERANPQRDPAASAQRSNLALEVGWLRALPGNLVLW
jgi:hypothetical protein